MSVERLVMSVRDWQNRLEANFLEDTVLSAKIHGIVELEFQARIKFETDFQGYSKLSDSCTVFFLDTLQASSSLRNKSNIVNANDDLVAIDLMMSLRRLRASALVASQGYHGPAFSLLRDIRDKSLLLSAYFQRKVSYGKLSGVDENFPSKGTKAEIRNRTRKVRVSSEKNIFEEMLDFNDITDETQRTDLGIWKDSFDRENHGSSISAASATKTWHLDRQPLYLVNIEDRSLMTQYINRFCDVAWMFHRLLPNLQLSAHKFDEKWKERWDILDHSFWMMENGLTEIGRPIGAAMIELVEKRFPFNANSFFDS